MEADVALDERRNDPGAALPRVAASANDSGEGLVLRDAICRRPKRAPQTSRPMGLVVEREVSSRIGRAPKDDLPRREASEPRDGHLVRPRKDAVSVGAQQGTRTKVLPHGHDSVFIRSFRLRKHDVGLRRLDRGKGHGAYLSRRRRSSSSSSDRSSGRRDENVQSSLML